MPIIRRNHCIYATLVFVTMYGWRLVSWLDWNSNQHTRRAPIQIDKHQCRIDTAIFSWWWAHGYPKHVEKRNKYTKQNFALSWIYLQESRPQISHINKQFSSVGCNKTSHHTCCQSWLRLFRERLSTCWANQTQRDLGTSFRLWLPSCPLCYFPFITKCIWDK